MNKLRQLIFSSLLKTGFSKKGRLISETSLIRMKISPLFIYSNV